MRILNQRLKRLHSDRETLAKMVADLVQATTLANAAIMEMTAALEAETSLGKRLAQAEKLESVIEGHVTNGTQLVERIARITAAAKSQPLPEPAKAEAAKPEPARPAQLIEPQSRLHSALQQLAMRPGIGGKAA